MTDAGEVQQTSPFTGADAQIRTGDPLAELNRELVVEGLWNRPNLAIRDRRLITMTILSLRGAFDFVGVHVRAALAKNELTLEELQEMAVQVAFYGGWPLGNKLQRVISEAVKELDAKPE